MTLILSCATPNYVFQVSDRRLTLLSGPNQGSVVDDESNKAVLVGQRMAFAYTGLAEINGMRTDLWLTHAASGVPQTDLAVLCERIRDKASAEFRTLGVDRAYRRHAFVGVGWRTTPLGPLQPILCTISNAIGPNGEWQAEAAPEFTTRVNNWGRAGSGFGIAATGQTLHPNEKYAIWRLLRRCAKKHTGPPAFLRSLTLAMDFAASRYNTVGTRLLAVSMPRTASEEYVRTGSFTMLAGGPLYEQNTFLYLSPNAGPVSYGPNVAGSGQALTGFRVTYFPETTAIDPGSRPAQ